MDRHKENIKCVKGEETKFFSQHQLDTIGQSRDGSFDGWVPQTSKPVGIPDETVIDNPPGEVKLTHQPISDDPNGTLPVTPVADPNAAPVDLNATPETHATDPVDPETPPANPDEEPVDPSKKEKVNKPGKTPKGNGNK